MFPSNLMEATFRQAQTTYHKIPKTLVGMNYTATELEQIVNGTLYTVKPGIEMKDGINVLGIIVFCIAFGITIGGMGERGRLMVDFFVILDAIIMRIVSVIMWYSPFGIMCLIMGKILEIENLAETAEMLGMYMVTVIVGLAIHALITLPGLYFICTRKNPVTFCKGLLQAWVTALGTASR